MFFIVSEPGPSGALALRGQRIGQHAADRTPPNLPTFVRGNLGSFRLPIGDFGDQRNGNRHDKRLLQETSTFALSGVGSWATGCTDLMI